MFVRASNKQLATNNKFVKLFFLPLLLPLASCNALKAAQLPPTTSASYSMRGDIVRSIDSFQKIHEPECKKYEITDARIAASRDMAVLEEWRILACGVVITYDVQITYSDYGGKTFNVTRRN